MASPSRAFSSPDLVPSPRSQPSTPPADHSLEGIATNVKLLLKIIQDHNVASMKDYDDRKMQRIAGMIAIIDDIKSRIEKSQSGKKKELRRCNTDLKLSHAPRDHKKPQEYVADEKEKLKRQVSEIYTARKSLEMVCSSLGKEKEIMASELAKKAHELNEMEELVNDLKEQNATLLSKLKACASEDQKKKKPCEGETSQGNAALQERNKVLSEQLLKSIEGYRSLKRKYKNVKDENAEVRATMEEIRVEVAAGLESIHNFRQRMASADDCNHSMDIENEISILEQTFQRFNLKITKNLEKNLECNQHRAEVSTSKPQVLA